ncbi:MAG: hypothetical protein A3H68_02190 [Candidatus Taylorbacteria bacterium RIFCSPLOWO2_02_FULL_46_40]|uniref:Uncharacterized protein n=1 Tax=Candidatus Taylorbacteria bacterium RIFCSPLOWO2_02_FULL_46_40 TaxID=1802329 RepID=A0A1G2P1C5_9BACT|nr:MAG: hypothetical protein A3H68_02190 [Candidatus Taylorbacteria bacterium RIFCSPLOWO2_02_FULL_46_40]
MSWDKEIVSRTPSKVRQFLTVNHKLRKVDFILIAAMSVVLATLTFYSTAGYFYNIEQGDIFVRYANVVLRIPVIIAGYPLFWLLYSPASPEGSSLGAGILLTFLSPLFAFIFWFVLFLLLVRLSVRVTKSVRLLPKHVLSLVILFVLVIPYTYYQIGSNEINACLSGSLNYEWQSSNRGKVTIGPDSCFDDITDVKTRTNNPARAFVEFCLDLPEDKIVYGTHSSFREYCIYTLGRKLNPVNNSLAKDFHTMYLSNSQGVDLWTMSQVRLCELYGIENNSEEVKNKCVLQFLQWYLLGQGKESVINAYCAHISSQPTPRECTEIPPQLNVEVRVNGSHDSPTVKLDSEFVVSWKVTGQAEICRASGSFSPRADGEGKWAQGKNIDLSTKEGSMTLVATQMPIVGYEVYCSPNADKPAYYIARDNVVVNVTAE